MNTNQVSLEVVNPNAAGIDIGSRSHWVAVGQDAQDVREFGVYTQDHLELSQWLRKHMVKTIAMESTGTYWQNIFSYLVAEGFEVILVNGRQTKNIKGKKTDIKDCQWIQKLHTLGLLSSSFLPDSTTDIIRTYSRHRQNLLKQSSTTVLKMQKYLFVNHLATMQKFQTKQIYIQISQLKKFYYRLCLVLLIHLIMKFRSCFNKEKLLFQRKIKLNALK